MPGVSE